MSTETFGAVVTMAVCMAAIACGVGMACYVYGRRAEKKYGPYAEKKYWLRWAENHPNPVVREAWVNEALRSYGYRCSDSPEVLGQIPFAQPIPDSEFITHA